MTFRLSNLIPTEAIDIVGVYDENYIQLFPEARPIKDTVMEESTFMRHPIEDSTTRVDHIVRQPVAVSITFVLSGEEYRNIYQQMLQVYRDQTRLIVQTKTNSYENMYIQQMPHDETPDAVDAVIVVVNFVETLLAETDVQFIPAEPKSSNTVSRGQQEPQPDDTGGKSQSFLFRAFTKDDSE